MVFFLLWATKNKIGFKWFFLKIKKYVKHFFLLSANLKRKMKRLPSNNWWKRRTIVSSVYSYNTRIVVKCAQMNCKSAYRPQRKAVWRWASRTQLARGRDTQRHLETSFVRYSMTTGFGLVNPEFGSGTTEPAVANCPLRRQSLSSYRRRTNRQGWCKEAVSFSLQPDHNCLGSSRWCWSGTKVQREAWLGQRCTWAHPFR